jgi:hypothetical protein
VGTVWIAELLHRADSLGCGLLDRADCWVTGCWLLGGGSCQTARPYNPTTGWAGGAAWLTCCGLMLSFITPGTFGTQRHASGYPSFLVREGESSEGKRSHVMYSNTSADGPSSYML